MGFRFAGFSFEVYVFCRELCFLAEFYYLATYLIISSYTAAGVSSLGGVLRHLSSKLSYYYVLACVCLFVVLCTRGCNRVCIMLECRHI